MMSDNESDWQAAAELLMPLEDLAIVVGVPVAFVRLAVDCGCPAKNGYLSHLTLVCWLAHHYERVRKAAALRALPRLPAVSERQRIQLQLRNMLLTMVDYTESRCSDPAKKRALRDWSLRIASGADG